MEREQSAQAEAAGTVGEALADDFLKGANVQPPAGGQAPPQGKETPTSESKAKPLSGKVLVDYDGAPREVDIGDLVKAHRSAGDLTQARSALNTLIEEGGIGLKVAKALEDMPPERRSQVLRSIFEDGGSGERQGSNDDPFSLADELLSDRQQQGRGDDGVHKQLELLTQAVMTILQDRKSDEESRELETLTKRVDDKLDSFPGVRAMRKVGKDGEGKAMVELARQSILSALSSQPNANLDDLVAKMATKLNGFVGMVTQGAVEERTEGRDLSSFLGQAPKAEELTADALLNGTLRKNIEGRLGSKRFG